MPLPRIGTLLYNWRIEYFSAYRIYLYFLIRTGRHTLALFSERWLFFHRIFPKGWPPLYVSLFSLQTPPEVKTIGVVICCCWRHFTTVEAYSCCVVLKKGAWPPSVEQQLTAERFASSSSLEHSNKKQDRINPPCKHKKSSKIIIPSTHLD